MQEGIHKQDIVTLTNCGLVTSGNYRKFYEIDGEKYSHTIDPHTGEPVKHTLLCATVVMGDGIKDEKGVIYNSATADAYATWFMTIGLAKTQIEVSKIASTGRSVEAYLVYGEQDKMRVWFTPGLTLDSQK
jgi:thiamine biosynthesis lipoprotein